MSVALLNVVAPIEHMFLFSWNLRRQKKTKATIFPKKRFIDKMFKGDAG
jgi:hypothetical protein